MEATPGQDEMNKVQIADLKDELAKTEAALKTKTEEYLQCKKDLRTKDEEIQQRDIDISCLRGQVSQKCKQTADIDISCLRGQVNQLVQVVEDDDDTLTPIIDYDDNEDVFLEDLEWDPDWDKIKLDD